MARIDGMVDNAKDLIEILENAAYEYKRNIYHVLREARDYIDEIEEYLSIDADWPTTARDAIREKLDNLKDLLVRSLEI